MNPDFHGFHLPGSGQRKLVQAGYRWMFLEKFQDPFGRNFFDRFSKILRFQRATWPLRMLRNAQQAWTTSPQHGAKAVSQPTNKSAMYSATNRDLTFNMLEVSQLKNQQKSKVLKS